MGKRKFNRFSIILAAIVILLSYQNCGSFEATNIVVDSAGYGSSGGATTTTTTITNLTSTTIISTSTTQLTTTTTFFGVTTSTTLVSATTTTHPYLTTSTTTLPPNTTTTTLQNPEVCRANQYSEWIQCRNRLIALGRGTIYVTGVIACPDQSCLLEMRDSTSVRIEGEGGRFHRTGGFNKPLFQFQNIQSLILKNIAIDEPANIAIQLTAGAPEINQICQQYSGGVCDSSINIYGSSSVILDGIEVNNGKVFGVALSGNQTVMVQSSRIVGAWWFGIWGQKNVSLTFRNNNFVRSRANAILVDFTETQTGLIEGNVFDSNHHATAFHTCDGGSKPCPGGQVDLVNNVRNVQILNNRFINGRMSGEFPEDLNYDWVSGIEFEPHAGTISNVLIQGNTMENSTGSAMFINVPDGGANKSILNNVEFSRNISCNMRTTEFGTPRDAFYLRPLIVTGNTTCP